MDKGKPSLLTITLHVNELNFPIKWHRVNGKKETNKHKNQDPIINCLQETHCRFIDTDTLKVKGWKINSLEIPIPWKNQRRVKVVVRENRL